MSKREAAALWAEKLRPRTLDKLSLHPEVTQHLERLCSEPGFPHLLVCGPSGAGKKTRIMAALTELFGEQVNTPHLDTRTLTTPSGKKIEVPLMVSRGHLEFNPADVGVHDRVVVQDVIKEMAKTQNIDPGARFPFKVVVIAEAETLSVAAQHVLRRTLEKYMANLRVILCCNSTSRIIPAIQSRCLCLRVPAPGPEHVTDLLLSAAKTQNIALPPNLARHIAMTSRGNVRRALLSLEALYVVSGRNLAVEPSQLDMSVLTYDWEQYAKITANLILQQQTPEGLLAVRERLYELLAHCIPPSLILKTLAKMITPGVPTPLRPTVAIEAAKYDHTLALGSKPIYHLEAFVAKVMSICSSHRASAF